jgi:hypothetical protein
MLQQVLGLVAVALSLIGLTPYIYNAYRGRTRPHLFTWLIWTPMTFIAFAAQVVDHGGPGAWTTGVTAVLCLFPLVISIRNGTHDIRPLDWVSLVVAVLAGVAWLVTDDPTISVILVTLIDAVAFVPTIRKSIHKPYEETLLNYVTSASKHTLSIAALTHFSLLTALYPAVVGLMNGICIGVLTIRRRQIPSSSLGNR